MCFTHTADCRPQTAERWVEEVGRGFENRYDYSKYGYRKISQCKYAQWMCLATRVDRRLTSVARQ